MCGSCVSSVEIISSGPMLNLVLVFIPVLLVAYLTNINVAIMFAAICLIGYYLYTIASIALSRIVTSIVDSHLETIFSSKTETEDYEGGEYAEEETEEAVPTDESKPKDKTV